MILSSEGRSSGVLSILQDSVSPSGVAPRSLFRFGDGRDCVEDELEDLRFRLSFTQLSMRRTLLLGGYIPPRLTRITELRKHLHPPSFSS